MTECEAATLKAMPATCAHLMEVLGFTRSVTWQIIQGLKTDRLCFVMRWNGCTAIYAAGRGRDARRIDGKCLSRKEINARAYQKRKRKAQAKGPFAALFQI